MLPPRRHQSRSPPLSRYRRRAPAFAALAAVALAAWFPASAAAHAELASSSPAANASVKVAPRSVVLTFTEPIDPANSTVHVLTESQVTLAGVGEVRMDGAGTTATVSLPALQPGVYTVSYLVTSADDGHVTSGLFDFLFDPTGTLPAPSTGSSSSSPSTDAGTVAARWAALLLMLVLFGLVLFWLASARPAIAAAQPTGGHELAALGGTTVWGVLAVTAFAAFVALGVFLTLAASAIGSSTGHESGLPLDFAAPFGWTGFAIAMRVALACTAVAFVLASVRFLARSETTKDGWLLVCVLLVASAALAGSSFAGHAAAIGGPVFAAIDWLHLVGVASWLGTLSGLALLAWTTSRVACERRAILREALTRHSRLALVAAPTVAITGLANSPLVLGTVRGIVASDYGNLVLLKALLFSIAVAIGSTNFFLARRASLRRTTILIAGEAVMGALAVVVAATMVTIQPAASRVPILSESALSTAHLYGTAGDATVHAVVNIPAPGDQLYQVVVADATTGAPLTDVGTVSLLFTPPSGSDLPTRRVTLAQDGAGGIWAIHGTYTPVVGDWKIAVVVQRSNHPGAQASFDLPVRLPIPPQLVPPPDTGLGVPAPLAALWLILPSGTPGWLVVVVVLAGVAGASVALRGRRTGEPAKLLRGLRLALVVVALIAGLGVGSRALVTAANAPPPGGPANPIPATSDSVARGERIYLANCSSCHGVQGDGAGPQAAGMLPAPGAIGASVRALSDSGLQSLVTNGISATGMPSFATSLSENDRWDLVNYLRATWPAAP